MARKQMTYYYIVEHEGAPLPNQVWGRPGGGLVVIEINKDEAILERLKGRTLYSKEELSTDGSFSGLTITVVSTMDALGMNLDDFR